jgi:hypothetical protein
MKTHACLLLSAVCPAAITGLTAPTITTQPADQTVNQGFSTTFRTTATTPAPPLSYQWFFASDAITGATTNVLTISNAQPADAGQYFVVVTDAITSSTSRVATLTVVPPAALDPKLSANIRLGDDPPELPGNRRAQTEPHIARSYVDPNLLFATFMEGTANPAALAYGYAVSTNGGVTWSRALMPGLTVLTGGQRNRKVKPTAVVSFWSRSRPPSNRSGGVPAPIGRNDLLVPQTANRGWLPRARTVPGRRGRHSRFNR